MRHSIAAPRCSDVLLRERQLLAGGDADLRLDQVDAGHHFGHRMLDLNAGVDLDEVKIAFLIDDELDRAGVGVVGCLIEPHGRLAHRPAHVRQAVWGGAFLDQLLMPPLHRAVALPEMHDVAVMVGDDLHFDVPRALDVFFEINAAIAEGGLGFGASLLQGRLRAPSRSPRRACPARRRRPWP